MKPVLISGIQPTGKPHLGNYLGFLADFINFQKLKEYKCYFFIADLHSLTENISSAEKTDQIKKTFSVVRALGMGITEDTTTFFLQSAVPAHAELAIILNNLTPFSELRRMTQFKDKSKDQSKNINVGLFDYPVLMAADILLYNASLVPVGDDQQQHLELARTLARKFNDVFGKVFTEPKAKFSKIPRVMSLDDPTKKMSKSRPAGCLFIDDSESEIRKKIGRAVTDSGNEVRFDLKKKPAISNLMRIYSVLNKGESDSSIESRYSNKGYVEFKNDLAGMIVKLIGSVRKCEEDNKLYDSAGAVLKEGSKRASEVASKKLEEVKGKLGLIL